MESSERKRVPEEVRTLAGRLSESNQMRRGSVSVRFMKCGKDGCSCAEDPEARHGPYFTLTRSVKGKTQSRYLSPEQAETAKRQIEAGHEFRETVERYWDACEEWSDELLLPRNGSIGSAQKKRAQKNVRRGNPNRNRRIDRRFLRRGPGFRSSRDGSSPRGASRGCTLP